MSSYTGEEMQETRDKIQSDRFKIRNKRWSGWRNGWWKRRRCKGMARWRKRSFIKVVAGRKMRAGLM